MAEPLKKAVIVPFDGGEAHLVFTKLEDHWICRMDDEMMQTLQTCLNGQEPKELVKWVDIPNLGDE